MATPALAEEQLIELLLQLKKTTPDAARQILNSQPQIAYALISLMVKLDAINVHVLQKTLSDFSNANPAPPTQVAQPASAPPIAPPSATPAQPQPQHHHYQQHQQQGYYGHAHRDTPPAGANGYRDDTYSHGYPSTAPAAHREQGYSTQPQPQQPSQIPPHVYDALSRFPEDQKAMLMRVIQMTPEQINALAPQDRANIAQLRATLGVPT